MVLIINKSKKRAEEVADLFRYMGIVALGATPPEALNILTPAYRAILMCDPDTIPDLGDYLKRVRGYISSPVFCLFTDNRGGDEEKRLFDGVFSDGSYSSTIAIGMARVSRERGLIPAGVYKCGGIDASCDEATVSFLGRSVKLTRTEAMILRYVMATYPTPQTPGKIIEHAFRSGKRPEPAAIRTHVSVMNKKWREATGRALIFSVTGRGYVLSTPVLREKYHLTRTGSVQ